MQVFITGTDTEVGKTLVSSWICLHANYDYFKPIQTGSAGIIDSSIVKSLSNCKIYPESYVYKFPASPHIASALENDVIDINMINLPKSDNLIVEGVGGLMVPINKELLMIDLIKILKLPVILVINPKLGAINHSLLGLEALKIRNINMLGVIFSGKVYDGSYDIAAFGNTKILAELPHLNQVTKQSLAEIPLSKDLEYILGVK